jgi:dTDP-4-amino-4,6-dideoxygalactose transaminase
MKPTDSLFLFAKGRTALFAVLRSAGVGEGHRVLVPGYTCVVVPQAIRRLGAIPEYADIDPAIYSPTLENYERVYQRLAQRGESGACRALLVQHTYGIRNPQTERIVAWARDKGMLVVEDCAHLDISDVRVGGLAGDAAFFSSQWSKPFTTGLGGALLVVNPQLRQRVAQDYLRLRSVPPWRSLALLFEYLAYSVLFRPSLFWMAQRSYRALTRWGLVQGSSAPKELAGEYRHDPLHRMGPFQRWLFSRQARHGSARVRARRDRTAEWLAALGRARIPAPTLGAGAALLRIPILVSDRNRLLQEARRRGVELGDWFSHPLHPEEAARFDLNWSENACPVATAIAKRVVNLPTHGRIRGATIARTIELLTDYVTPRSAATDPQPAWLGTPSPVD